MIAISIALFEVGPALAQEPPPSPAMLLNLDLFRPKPPDAQSPDSGDESLLDQIRTLNSMGLLSGNSGTPTGYPMPGEPPAPQPPPPPPPPGYDGPQSDFGGQPE